MSFRTPSLLSCLALGELLLAQPPTYDVDKTPTSRFPSIQAAVDAAVPGSTIRIGPGRFDECLAIRKTLTLTGAGPTKTILTSAQSDGLVRVRKARDVVLRQLRVSSRAPAVDGILAEVGIITLDHAGVRLEDCVVDGGPGCGVRIARGSTAVIRRCLIARIGSIGIQASQGGAELVRVLDSEIRGSGYCGIRIGGGCHNTIIERCRITGAAFHGIRYDDCAPQIHGNLFFANERTAIYASGKTQASVRGNAFLGEALTCWFANQDTITGNTFSGRRTGIRVLGGSHPKIHRNIFHRMKAPITIGDIGRRRDARSRFQGIVDARDNRMWMVTKTRLRTGQDLLDPSSKNALRDPEFVDAPGGDLTLKPGSPARKRRVGAAEVLAKESPWPADAARPLHKR